MDFEELLTEVVSSDSDGWADEPGTGALLQDSEAAWYNIATMDETSPDVLPSPAGPAAGEVSSASGFLAVDGFGDDALDPDTEISDDGFGPVPENSRFLFSPVSPVRAPTDAVWPGSRTANTEGGEPVAEGISLVDIPSLWTPELVAAAAGEPRSRSANTEHRRKARLSRGTDVVMTDSPPLSPRAFLQTLDPRKISKVLADEIGRRLVAVSRAAEPFPPLPPRTWSGDLDAEMECKAKVIADPPSTALLARMGEGYGCPACVSGLPRVAFWHSCDGECQWRATGSAPAYIEGQSLACLACVHGMPQLHDWHLRDSNCYWRQVRAPDVSVQDGQKFVVPVREPVFSADERFLRAELPGPEELQRMMDAYKMYEVTEPPVPLAADGHDQMSTASDAGEEQDAEMGYDQRTYEAMLVQATTGLAAAGPSQVWDASPFM